MPRAAKQGGLFVHQIRTAPGPQRSRPPQPQMALRVASIALTEYNSDVYEPSDDSFALVDALEAAAPAWRAQRPRTCAEIGCGSGYVICSLAMLLRQLGICGSLFATDISQHALDATRRTLRAHAVGSVELLRTNLLDGLLDRLERRVDVLVSAEGGLALAARPALRRAPPRPSLPGAR